MGVTTELLHRAVVKTEWIYVTFLAVPDILAMTITIGDYEDTTYLWIIFLKTKLFALQIF